MVAIPTPYWHCWVHFRRHYLRRYRPLTAPSSLLRETLYPVSDPPKLPTGATYDRVLRRQVVAKGNQSDVAYYLKGGKEGVVGCA